MPGIYNILPEADARWDQWWWWPTVPAGFYSFSGGTLFFRAQDRNGDVVFELNGDGTPNDNGSYIVIGDTDFSAANGTTVPAGCWFYLYLSPTDTLEFATQTLNYLITFAPATETAFAFAKGLVVFGTDNVVAPEVMAL